MEAIGRMVLDIWHGLDFDDSALLPALWYTSRMVFQSLNAFPDPGEMMSGRGFSTPWDWGGRSWDQLARRTSELGGHKSADLKSRVSSLLIADQFVRLHDRSDTTLSAALLNSDFIEVTSELCERLLEAKDVQSLQVVLMTFWSSICPGSKLIILPGAVDRIVSAKMLALTASCTQITDLKQASYCEVHGKFLVFYRGRSDQLTLF